MAARGKIENGIAADTRATAVRDLVDIARQPGEAGDLPIAARPGLEGGGFEWLVVYRVIEF